MRTRRVSRQLTFEDAVSIHFRLMDGEIYSRITAEFDINPARVAEVKFGHKFAGSREEALRRRGLA